LIKNQNGRFGGTLCPARDSTENRANHSMTANNTKPVNQLVLIIVSERQGSEFMQALVRERFFFTKIDSSGLVFQEPNIFLLIGLNNTRLSGLMGLVDQYCQPYKEYIPVQFNHSASLPPLAMIEAKAGGALVYVMDVERFEQF
jgi:uncharacterized protein YaaQ